MSLSSAIGRINNKLKDTFAQKPYDPAPGRKRVIRMIDNAASQYLEGKTKAPNRAWRTGHEAVSFQLDLNGEYVPIGGERINYLAPEDFQPFLADLKAAVEAGELDQEIRAALESKAGGSSVAVVAQADKPDGKSCRGSISPEAAKARGEAAARTRAANRAAREAAQS